MLDSVLAVDWPLIVFPTLVGGGVLTMGWVWLRNKFRRERVEKALDDFKTSAVHAGDVMDALRERHQRLPVDDPDFTLPMEGRTREEYLAIEAVLDQYRDRWLDLMEVWDNVQELIKNGRRKQYDDAMKLLEDSGELEHLTALESECRERIARLGDAHEVAREAVAGVESLGQELIDQLSEIEGRSYTTDPYQTEMDEIAEVTDVGTRQLIPDPLTAIETLADARSQLTNLLRRTHDVLRCEELALELDKEFQAQKQRVEVLRLEGLLFAEPDASPEPIITEYDRLRPEVTDQLNHGTIEGAERSLDAARRQAERLRTLLDTCVEMRQHSHTLLQARRVALRRLLDDATTADLEEQKLAAGYPVDTWRGFIDNLDAARVMMATMSELLGQAESAIDEKTQHYIRAHRLLDEVRDRETEVAEAIAAVARHRAELDTQRDECQRRIRKIETEADRVGRLLQQSRADRDLCNHRYRMARDGLQTILRSTSQTPTDWPHLAAKVEECGSDFERVEELFHQDTQLYKQAESEITKAEREIRRARSFYRAGVAADTSRANAILLDARRALSDQDYERAVQHANQAEQAARDARGEAQRKMEHRQRDLDRRQWDQRQRQMRSLVDLGSTVAARAIRELTRR